MTSVQLAPFQTSLTGTAGSGFWSAPTALQKEVPTQDTALKSMSPSPGGVGVSLQVEPFQASASAWIVDEICMPTAMQEAGVVHETPDNWVLAAPAGIGRIVGVHVAPFH